MASTPLSPPPAVADPDPTVGELFIGFLLMGLMGFGGVLPLSRRILVDERRWLTGEDYTELLGLCQFLPGGNIMNLSVAVGLRFRGLMGALACIIGVVSAPTLIVIGLGVIYDRFQDDPNVRHIFLGLAAAAAGLLLSLAWKILRPLFGKPIGLAIAAVCVAAIAVLKLPLLMTMIVMAPASMLVMHLTRRRERATA